MALPKDRIVSMTADGAAANMGVHNGVKAHFRMCLNKSICIVHCSPHRAELCAKDGQNRAGEIFVELELLIQGIYNYASGSANRNSKYKKLAMDLQDSGGGDRAAGKIASYTATRWTSKRAAVTSVCNALPIVLEMLSSGVSDKDAMAMKLYPTATDSRVLAALFCLKDILVDLDTLSKVLQTKGISVYECREARESCITDLLNMTDPPEIKEDPGDDRNFYFPSYDFFLKTVVGSDGRAYERYGLTHCEDRNNVQKVLIRSGVLAFRDTVVGSLRARWDTDEDRQVELFAIFDPKGMDGKMKYGRDQIQQIGQMFHFEEGGEDDADEAQKHLHGPLKVNEHLLLFEWTSRFLKSREYKRLATRDGLPDYYNSAEKF